MAKEVAGYLDRLVESFATEANGGAKVSLFFLLNILLPIGSYRPPITEPHLSLG